MFFYLTLHEIETGKVSDHPLDPFNSRVELYQTWNLAELDPLIPPGAANQAARWARQGFSLRGAPDDGSSFGKNEKRYVVDPQIAFAIDDALPSGKRMQFRFDVHYWESDQSSEKVRAVFNDTTLAYMASAWQQARADEKKALEQLDKWLSGNAEQILRKALAVAGVTSPGVGVALDLLPVLDLLADYVKANGDDYHQCQRYLLSFEKTDEGLKWQVTSPSGGSPMQTGPGRVDLVEPVSDAADRTNYKTRWIFRVVD